MAGKGSKPGERRGGRQKGTANKITASMKEAFLHVYAALQDDQAKETKEEGEHQHLFAWAKTNPNDFYRICSKLIPTQITADVRHVTAEDMTDAELTDIACSGSGRTTKPASGEKNIH